jgi:hypothetical protein
MPMAKLMSHQSKGFQFMMQKKNRKNIIRE